MVNHHEPSLSVPHLDSTHRLTQYIRLCNIARLCTLLSLGWFQRFTTLSISSLTIKFQNCSSSILFFQLNDRSVLFTIMATDLKYLTSLSFTDIKVTVLQAVAVLNHFSGNLVTALYSLHVIDMSHMTQVLWTVMNFKFWPIFNRKQVAHRSVLTYPAKAV